MVARLLEMHQENSSPENSSPENSSPASHWPNPPLLTATANPIFFEGSLRIKERSVVSQADASLPDQERFGSYPQQAERQQSSFIVLLKVDL
jgi:hypothetical protein